MKNKFLTFRVTEPWKYKQDCAVNYREGHYIFREIDFNKPEIFQDEYNQLLKDIFEEFDDNLLDIQVWHGPKELIPEEGQNLVRRYAKTQGPDYKDETEVIRQIGKWVMNGTQANQIETMDIVATIV